MKITMIIATICIAGSLSAANDMPADFVEIRTVIPDIILDIRYATTNNFLGVIHNGFYAAKAWCVKEAADALSLVQNDLKPQGLKLKIYDAYRPMSSEWQMIEWALAAGKRSLIGIYIPGSINPLTRYGHVCGNMIDVTLVDKAGKELVMGTGYDEFSTKANTMNASGLVLSNRMLLLKTMEKRGFKNYSGEWWHFKYTAKEHEALNTPIR
ncbi:MAG: M15 family metallopeptidase [Spirochaetota bacterium]